MGTQTAGGFAADGWSLEARLEHLERRSRRQRALNLALLGLLALTGLAALRSPEPEVVQARRFEVVNPDGVLVGSFGFGGAFAEQALGLSLWHLESGASAQLAVSELSSDDPKSGPMGLAYLHLEQGQGIVNLGASDQQTSLGLYCDHDDRSAVLHVGRAGHGLALTEPTGEPEPSSREVLRLDSEAGAARIRGWNARGESSIELP